MSTAARLGQLAVVLVIAGVCCWLAARRHARHRGDLLARLREAQEP